MGKWSSDLLLWGGASVDFYKKVFRIFENNKPPYKFVHMCLEFPEDLDSPLLPDGSFDRLSVAYGLSYDPYDIGEIIKKSEIEDDVEPEGDKTMKQCPSCNGSGGPTGGCPKCGGIGFSR